MSAANRILEEIARGRAKLDQTTRGRAQNAPAGTSSAPPTSPPGRVVVPHVTAAARAHLAAELIEKGRLPVLIARDAEDAEQLFGDLAFLLGTTEEKAPETGLLFFGADDSSPYEEYSPDGRAVMERINTLYRLAHERDRIRAVVVSPVVFTRRHVPKSLFEAAGEYVVKGEEIDRDRLLRRLADSGYNPVSSVEDPGTFSVRGGIIDIYSPHRSNPIRLDLFGDEVDSIRLFDPSTQRTEAEVEDAVILPAREHVYSEGTAERLKRALEALGEEILVPTRKLSAFLDDVENHIHFFGIESFLPLFFTEGLTSADAYLPRGPEVVVLLHDEEAIHVSGEELWAEARAGYAHAKSTHQLALPPEAHLAKSEDVLATALADADVLTLADMHLTGERVVDVRYEETSGLRGEILKATRAIEEGGDVLAPVVERLRDWRSQGLTTLLVAGTRGQAERLRELLTAKKLHVRLRSEPFSIAELHKATRDAGQKTRDREEAAPVRGVRDPRANTLRDPAVHAWIVLGGISGGFVHPEGRLALISEEEIFGQRMKRRRRRAPAAGAFVSDLADLRPGDFVVHVDYGIGLYHGLTKLAVNGVMSDFLHVEYKGNDKLYVPVDRLRLIQKYSGAAEGKSPPLDRLGAQTWANTKKKVKDTLLKMAAELIRLYAMRSSLEGFAFRAPDDAFTQFEAEFPFEPTPDQAKAIDDVVRDLQKPSPMDRLISGDVGYGKTEVAMRATMLGVLSGKQVAVLVPTTVLAAQHFQVFKDRFQNYPVQIGIVSRFQSAAETRETLEKAKAGKIDVLIGTHRLLSKDVVFKDLGLLVIDEEHRFGVADKEKLKKYRATVHVLSMSATPIPRTLHMGFMGVRDMSMIATPPVDRLAVKTEVHKFSEEVIREAILREIRRGGQCFVVHNRVASISAFKRMIERLVPEARVSVGHGQMSEDELEKVMVDFMARESNVLLSTTIIESGIDIPNANTIIINRADTLGLAQLYQLRGRVGRSKVRGFAHFLVPAGNLSPKAKKRIAVLQRFTELGAGFKVAAQDLEIRGAGNLLGKQQSGTIAAVGFDMYQALLGEAVAELKGSGARSLKDPEVQVPVPALIPDNYVQSPGERLSYYQRFSSADTDEATYDALQQLTDLYGTPPAEVENLAQLMLVKQRLSRLAALGLDYGGETKLMPARIVVRFDHEATPAIRPDQLVAYVQRASQRRRLTPEGKLVIHLAPFDDPREILQQAKDQLDELLRFRMG